MSPKDRLLDFVVALVGAAITHAAIRWVDKFFDPPEDSADGADDEPEPQHGAVIDELTP